MKRHLLPDRTPRIQRRTGRHRGDPTGYVRFGPVSASTRPNSLHRSLAGEWGRPGCDRSRAVAELPSSRKCLPRRVQQRLALSYTFRQHAESQLRDCQITRSEHLSEVFSRVRASQSHTREHLRRQRPALLLKLAREIPAAPDFRVRRGPGPFARSAARRQSWGTHPAAKIERTAIAAIPASGNSPATERL